MTEWKRMCREWKYPAHSKRVARLIHHRRRRRVARQLIAMGREELIVDRPLSDRYLY